MSTVYIDAELVSETLEHLKAGGRRGTECVVLWLAEEDDDGTKIVRQVYRPEQFAKADIFRISPDEMRRILALISQEGLMIAAQVHSHPREAFHSLADDTWAIVRHTGALSLVVPYFAAHTNLDSFQDHTATFCLDSRNRWIQVDTRGDNPWLKVE